MKPNTQKLLSWLYTPPGASPVLIDYPALALLFPHLTPGGRRSLARFLRQKYLIRLERTEGKTQLSLTSHGQAALAALFPLFSPSRQAWQGQWAGLFFLAAPNSDPQFRYLRSLLLEHHALDIRRGVYLFPGQFPSKVMDTCRDLYVGRVLIIQLQQWLFGDERRVVTDYYRLAELMEIYSGISKEVNQLLELKEQQKGLSHKSRRQVFSGFDRLFAVLRQDPGLIAHYYPHNQSGLGLLAKLQSLGMA